MKKITLLVPGLLLLIGGLASCSSNDKASKRENHLVIYNCQDYIDEELIEEFKKEYEAIQSEMDEIRASVDARTSQEQ